MSGSFSIRRADHWEVSLWLAFDSNGGVRMTRGSPSLSRSERGMALTVKLPLALFTTPQLRATITVDSPNPADIVIDGTAAAEALRQVLGCDIDLIIHNTDPPAVSPASPDAGAHSSRAVERNK